MPSHVAAEMLRKRQVQADPAEHMMEDGDMSGHPHQEAHHQEIDRQHAYDQASEALKSLAKDGMPGAEEMEKTLQAHWSEWVGSAKPMQPATKASHRASYVSKSPMDEQDEDMYQADDTDVTKDG